MATADPPFRLRRAEAGEAGLFVWAVGSSASVIAVLASRSNEILSNPAAWRAAVIPLLAASLLTWSSWRLFKYGKERLLVRASLLAQVIAFSIGPAAYRLVPGPFLMVSMTPAQVGKVQAGVAAQFICLVGDVNRMPEGVAINVVALIALAATYRISERRTTVVRPD